LKGVVEIFKKWLIKILFNEDVVEIKRLLNQISGMKDLAKVNLTKNLEGYLLALEEVEIIIKDLR
jgi:hypothetical protein